MKFSKKQKDLFKDKYGPWAVVTGASSGIGRELSLQIAQIGMNTVIVARNKEKLERLKSEITEKHSVEVQVVSADLSDGGVQKVIEAIANREIGLFVASAGFGTSGPFLKNSMHEEVNMLDVNCSSLLALTHYFAQTFSNKKRGGIILMSSIVAFQGVPFSANYAATKAYVQSLAEGLYHELKPHGVSVLAAAPGPVNSGFSSRANMKMGNVLRPEDIGIPILKALGRQTTVLPGRLTKILVYALRTVPRWGKVRIMKMVMGGMTAHQGD
ncbi:SDR family NAD(P)-dependent oxidoreductase [Fulvivirga sp. M361]|uniref:SDR family NAD(P)-dependent oxidoreductase n=1 Tax=Fulvivirga sp. M361 TaxID=2594266 RepID=UPI00117BC2E0|nr:SDR family NAD(P)-dependent oxidoreductase [Fulvivirga sp. M361]TRX48703.1 SDR family NAD(P)-dependent oxidoreductase [Fulvivirga sp. M361]